MSQIGTNRFFSICMSKLIQPSCWFTAVSKRWQGSMRPDDEIAATVRSLHRRQCAALCVEIRLHVTCLMESARFDCNHKLFCARRLRLSYWTSHMITRPERKRKERERERERERKKDRRFFPCLAKFLPILYCTLVELHSECSLNNVKWIVRVKFSKIENLNKQIFAWANPINQFLNVWIVRIKK